MATGTQLEKNAPGTPGQVQLTDRLSAVWTRGRVRWAGMSPTQRNWALAAAGLLAALLAGLLWYGLRTDWRTLYANMDPEDARQAAQVLTAAQIPFEPTADGTGIRVPVAQLDKARLATAAKGGVKSGRLGFELFDKPNWVGSEFDEQVNYQRALEGELEHTVSSLADVESARVHLVMTHDSLFRDQDRPAKASVVIKLRHRSHGRRRAGGDPQPGGLCGRWPHPRPRGAGRCGRQPAPGTEDRRRPASHRRTGAGREADFYPGAGNRRGQCAGLGHPGLTTRRPATKPTRPTIRIRP